MKALAMLLIVLFATVKAQSPVPREAQYSILVIEYVGIMDKPIFPIIIGDSQTGVEWYRTAVLKRNDLKLTFVHVVDAPLMAKLLSDAGVHRDAAQNPRAPTSSGEESVSITLVTAGNRAAFLLNTKSAVSFIDSLKKHSSSNKSLYSDLEHFQERIRAVSDTGTGQPAGITGKMTINIAADGKHFYEFGYTLPETH